MVGGHKGGTNGKKMPALRWNRCRGFFGFVINVNIMMQLIEFENSTYSSEQAVASRFHVNLRVNLRVSSRFCLK